jgi:acetylornithine/succinyldiaminopimelate/putrescine aminotransferase
MITEGKMQYLFDEKGRRYLDVSRAIAVQERFNIGPLASAAFTSCLSRSYHMSQLTAVCLLHHILRPQYCTPHILCRPLQAS